MLNAGIPTSCLLYSDPPDPLQTLEAVITVVIAHQPLGSWSFYMCLEDGCHAFDWLRVQVKGLFIIEDKSHHYQLWDAGLQLITNPETATPVPITDTLIFEQHLYDILHMFKIEKQ